MRVADLFAELGFKVDDKGARQFEGRLDKVKARLGDVGKTAKTIAKGLGVVGAAAGAAALGVFKLTESIAKAGDRFAKEGKKIGVSAVSLQELSFAAERAGANSEAIIKAITRMGKGLNDARVRGTGPFIDSMNQLGIDMAEFEGLTPEETFGRLADAIAGVDDGLTRAAIANDIFGRSGRDLVPLLVEGSAGIEAYRERARELGYSMSDEAAAGSEVFIDRLTDLKGALGGLKFTIGSELMPVIGEYVERVTDWIVKNRELIATKIRETLERVVEVVREGVPVVLKMIKGLGGLIEKMGGLESAVKLVVAGLVTMKLATLAAAGPWGILLAAAVAAGAGIGKVLADTAGGVQDLRFEIIELGVELKTLERNRQLFERREELAGQQVEALEKLERGAGQLSRAEFEELEDQARTAARRAGTAEETERTLEALRSRRRREIKQAAERGLEGVKGKRRERILAQAAERARQRGGGVGALEASIAEVRAGPARKPGKGGGKAAAAPAAPADEGPTIDELLDQAVGVETVGRTAAGGPVQLGTTINRIDASYNAPTTIQIEVDAPDGEEDPAAFGRRIAEAVAAELGKRDQRVFEHYRSAVVT